MKNKYHIIRFFFLVAFLFLGGALPLILEAQGSHATPEKELAAKGPIAIVSDQLEASDNDNEVIFIGRVVARQDNLTLSSDWVKVSYQDERQEGDNPLESSAEMAISRIDCKGTVQISKDDQVAVGDEAVYLAESVPRRIILTGNARLWQGDNYLSGHKVTYYLDENRSVVESADGRRVKATYYQNNKTTPQKPKPSTQANR